LYFTWAQQLHHNPKSIPVVPVDLLALFKEKRFVKKVQKKAVIAFE
jgi:hypothetical protein